MSKDIEFRIDAEDLIRQLERLGGQKAGEILATAAYQAGELLAADMRRRAPNSGFGRSSPKKNIRGKQYSFKLKDDIIVKSAKVTPKSILVRTVALPFYGWMVEKGTSKQSPQPFMRKSSDAMRGQVLAKFQEGVATMVRDTAR